jgi:hypothetical protein
MALPLIPVKTPDGQAELSSRQRRVSQRHRTVLLLVDGRRSEDEVRHLAVQAGVPDQCFDDLLELGLILLPQPTVVLNVAPPLDETPLHVDIPLAAIEPQAPDSVAADTADSVLPASRTLQPESVITDSMLGDAVSDSVLQQIGIEEPADDALEEARAILMRAVRTEAPLAGSLTLLRLKRARTRAALAGLMDEVEARITKPYRSLAAQQTLRRVRQLLATRTDSALPKTY